MQVMAAAQRVARLRGDVPEALSSHFRTRLQACRPMPGATEPEAAAERTESETPAEALSPAPAELQGKLASAATQMPMLR